MYLIKVSSNMFEKGLCAFPSGKHIRTENGLPEGCKLEVVRFKHDQGIVELFFSHPNSPHSETKEICPTIKSVQI